MLLPPAGSFSNNLDINSILKPPNTGTWPSPHSPEITVESSNTESSALSSPPFPPLPNSHYTDLTLDIPTSTSDNSILKAPISDKSTLQDLLLDTFKNKRKKVKLEGVRGLKRRCNYCSKLLLRDNMESHLSTCHRCEPCDDLFMSRAELQTHINIFHSQDPRFLCNFCNKAFNTGFIETHKNRCKKVKPADIESAISNS